MFHGGEPPPPPQVSAQPVQLLPPAPVPSFSPLPPMPAPATLSDNTIAQPSIAIIIDDLGEQWQAGKRVLALPGDITLAVLPFTHYGDRLVELAAQQGREVMLHAPMEPLSHPAWHEGLRRGMTQTELRDALAAMLEALPQARGVNNHMGSALTQERERMDWVMAELAGRGLYFIDSRTTPSSQALTSAQDHAIPSARRDVFLDNIRTEDAIEQQFRTLLRLARERGQAIAIGHPYPETLAFLERVLPQLGDLGVRLVPVSQLLHPLSEPASPPGGIAEQLRVESIPSAINSI
ncbi:MAG: divergent polysaccharide deacetylase family protein [Cellvibrionaceae bacterium]|nr:divergent polysaccharide deacetylase family protein [Cellvibrionaceae bacterium]